MLNQYLEKLIKLINQVANQELKNIEDAAKTLIKTIKNNGLIYVFGSGHSSIIATELFYRPGGLFNIYPIFYEPLMVHQGPLTSSLLERDAKILAQFLPKYQVNNNDCLIIISTSGINPVPLELARYFRTKGAKIIVISSKKYYQKIPSRDYFEQYLFDVGDILINNHIEIGDVVLENKNYHFGSLSTIIGCMIVNSITAFTISKLIDDNYPVDLIISGNTKHGLAHNQKLIKKYQPRIDCLK